MANIDGPGRPETIGAIEPIISQTTAGEMLSVSRESVKRAKKVKDEAVPELQDAVHAVPAPCDAGPMV